ncbi:DeoR/GlpR family DNA-binding transcription regulator [Bacillus sp. 03113]|uniref:DeoR/GlpR family DNA-binding transcription regulator n=1 Tax=Bacillus sp. 03113 TaxID=2578211 RepID=UPI001141F388|nr:DeoR/GlpR family DNA-binding transcription regulator [Bacillus sp. 03113]
MNHVTEERKQSILIELEQKGKVFVNILSEQLGVTPETIRRDLASLEEQRLLKRVHGGAVSFRGERIEPSFEKKRKIRQAEKKHIGEAAAKCIESGDTIVIDVGTTTLELCHAIHNVENITIVTNSLIAASTLNDRLEKKAFSGEIIILGGMLHTAQQSIKGALTAQMLNSFRVDKAFISCGGISQGYVSDFDIEEIEVSKVMMKISRESYLLADHSKINKEAFYLIGEMSLFDYLISDIDPDKEWKSLMKENNVTWITA